MSDPRPTLGAYVVALTFEGMVHMGTAMSLSREEAAAVVMMNAMRDSKPTSALIGVGSMLLPPEWLRAALQAIDTGKPSGEVLSLVPKAEPEPGPGAA